MSKTNGFIHTSQSVIHRDSHKYIYYCMVVWIIWKWILVSHLHWSTERGNVNTIYSTREEITYKWIISFLGIHPYFIPSLFKCWFIGCPVVASTLDTHIAFKGNKCPLLWINVKYTTKEYTSFWFKSHWH